MLLLIAQGRDLVAVAVEVAQGTAGHAAFGQVVLDARQAGHRAVVQACAQAAAVGQFHQVAKQAEAGDVGHGLDPGQLAEAAARGVQSAHPVAGQALVLVAQLGLFLGGGKDADAQRFGQVQAAADASGVVAFHVAFLHHAGHGQAEDRLGGIDGVPTGQGNARFGAYRAATTDHFTGHFRGQHVDWPAENGDGHQRVAAHGVDVADGVGGGDAAEVVRVIDDRHEEVGGRDHAALVVQRVHCCIVARGIADPQFRVQGLGAAFGENHLEHLRRDLAATTGAVAVLGQTNRLAHTHLEKS
ncbi:hypothetical protein D3C81_463690 [compost metagenome]